MIAWFDGEFVDGPCVPISDRAFRHGVGLFETLGAVDGALPLWGLHFERLAHSAGVLGIECAPPSGLHDAAVELLERASLRDGILRVTLSGGSNAPSWALDARARVELDRPIVLGAADARRGSADPTAAHKTSSRAFYELALAEVVPLGCDDALLLGQDDDVLETAYGNVFCASGGEICTPPLDGRVLPGVRRRVLVDALGERIRKQAIVLDDLRRADAIWVSNAVYGPRVAQLLDFTPPGSPSIDRELCNAWRAALTPA